MVEVRSFRGLVYNGKKIKDYNLVAAPPYDVISAGERDELYKKSGYNVVRLILGKIYKSDGRKNNRYSRAAAFIKKWMAQGVLVRDERPAFYVYLQEFTDPQTKKRTRRLGFIGQFVLQDFRKKNIYPHEWTLSKPKADRLKLIKATASNYSPVFSLYADKSGAIDRILKRALKRKPFINIRDKDNTKHTLFRLDEEKALEDIQRQISKKKLFIADGHHRYETALNYRQYVNKPGSKGKDIRAEATLMYFTNLENKGLKIYPIHRSVRNISKSAWNNLIAALEKYFYVTTAASKVKMLKEVLPAKTGTCTFGMYFNKKFYVLRLRDKKAAGRFLGKKKVSSVDKLNISLLHNVIINGILKTDLEDDVYYLKNPDTVIKDVDAKKYRAGFFLAGISAGEIIKTALKNERLPRKSTYFYPKLYSGLVINKMNNP